jgi:hypothetical protein
MTNPGPDDATPAVKLGPKLKLKLNMSNFMLSSVLNFLNKYQHHGFFLWTQATFCTCTSCYGFHVPTVAVDHHLRADRGIYITSAQLMSTRTHNLSWRTEKAQTMQIYQAARG